jgi:hypothetical protein
MGPRTRRAVAAAAILVFLGAYIVLATTLSDFLPNSGWIRLAYNLVVGVAWGAPILPLFAWAEREKLERQDRR